jgi:hypothetical protein
MRKSQWNPYAAENAWGENVDVRFGSLAAAAQSSCDVRFTPNSCRGCRRSARPLWARSGLPHRSKKASYSITSSAMLSSPDETVRPSVLAVLRLITSSNFVGA